MFEGIEAWFKQEFHQLSDEEKAILHYVLPIAQSAFGKIIAGALPLAVPIVESFFGGPGGTATRDAAVSQLKTQVVSQGIAAAEQVGTSALNFAVETILQNLNATKNPPAA